MEQEVRGNGRGNQNAEPVPGMGSGRGKKKAISNESISESDVDVTNPPTQSSDIGSETEVHNRPHHQRQLPYLHDTKMKKNYGTLCSICEQNILEGHDIMGGL